MGVACEVGFGIDTSLALLADMLDLGNAVVVQVVATAVTTVAYLGILF